MNERIDKLIEECTDRHFSDCVGGFETFDKEKFAELIVRECARVANDSNQSKNRAVGISVGDVVREHFGIENELV